MARPDPLAAEVLVTAEVSREQEQAIVKAFDALGVTARARTVPTRRGVGELQWLVLATLPLHAFLSGLGSTLAQETSQGLKRLVSRSLGDRREKVSPPPVLVLQDAATRLQVVLEPIYPPMPTRRCSPSISRRSRWVRCTTTDMPVGGARSWTKHSAEAYGPRIPPRANWAGSSSRSR